MRPTLAASVIALAALACSGSGPIPPPAPGVSGRVLDSDGRPVLGVEVHVQGQRAVTDAAGAFSLQGIEVPYDLTLFEAPNHATTFQGLTQRQLPDLRHPGPEPGSYTTPLPNCVWQAQVVGAEALAPDEIVEVFFCEDGAGSCTGGNSWRAVPATAGRARMEKSCLAARHRGTAYAFRGRVGADHQPVEWLSFGSAPASLDEAGAGSDKPLVADLRADTPIGSRPISFTLSVVDPIDPTDSSVWLGLRERGGRWLGGFVQLPPGAHQVALPDLPGSTSFYESYILAADDQGLGAFVSGAILGSSMTVAVPSWPRLASPAEGATVDAGAPFSWSGQPGAISELILMCRDVLRRVYTLGTQAKLPDVPGHPLPANVPCHWYVEGILNYSSIEARLAARWDPMSPALQVDSAHRAVTLR